LTAFTASDIVHRYCCRLVSWMKWNCITHPWHQAAAISVEKIQKM